MIQLTARIFQDGQVIGYQATDGTQTRNLTKQEAWAYAKQKHIINVVASGTLENPSLSGTNGFQLKNLPELTPEMKKIHYYELNATYIRNMINGNVGEIPYTDFENRVRELLNNDLMNGVIQGGSKNMHQMSNYFTLINALDHSKLKGGAIIPVVKPKFSTEEEKKEFREKVEIPLIKGEILNAYFEIFIDIMSRYKRTHIKPNRVIWDSLVDDVAMRAIESIVRHDKSLLAIDVDIRQLVYEVKNEVVDSKSMSEKQEIMEEIEAFGFKSGDKEINENLLDKLLEQTKKIQAQTIDGINQIRLVKEMMKYERAMESTTSIIGYKIKYTGPQPFEIDRVEVNFKSKSRVTLQPGESICLSNVETALLLSHPLINGKISNAELGRANKISRAESLYNILDAFYLILTKEFKEKHSGVSMHDAGFKIHIENYISQDEFNRYFATNKVLEHLRKAESLAPAKIQQIKQSGTVINSNGNIKQVNTGNNNTIDNSVKQNDKVSNPKRQDGINDLFNKFQNRK